MKSTMTMVAALMFSLLIGAAWARGDTYDRVSAASERMHVRTLRSAVQSFYRSLDNDDADAAAVQAGKIVKLWEGLDGDLRGKINTASAGTGQRIADLEAECKEPEAAATSQPASKPAAAAAKPAAKPAKAAPKADDNTAPTTLDSAPGAAPNAGGKVAVVAADVADAATTPKPWRPKYANDYDIFGDHPKGRCEKYKGATEEAAVQKVSLPATPATPAAPAATGGKKTAPVVRDGSIDQIIKTTPVKTPVKKKK